MFGWFKKKDPPPPPERPDIKRLDKVKVIRGFHKGLSGTVQDRTDLLQGSIYTIGTGQFGGNTPSFLTLERYEVEIIERDGKPVTEDELPRELDD